MNCRQVIGIRRQFSSQAHTIQKTYWTAYVQYLKLYSICGLKIIQSWKFSFGKHIELWISINQSFLNIKKLIYNDICILFIKYRLHSPANVDFFCANKMAPGVCEVILRSEHMLNIDLHSDLKNSKWWIQHGD